MAWSCWSYESINADESVIGFEGIEEESKNRKDWDFGKLLEPIVARWQSYHHPLEICWCSEDVRDCRHGNECTGEIFFQR